MSKTGTGSETGTNGTGSKGGGGQDKPITKGDKNGK